MKNVDVAFEFFLGKLCHYCVYVVSECAFLCMYGTTTTVALVIMLLYLLLFVEMLYVLHGFYLLCFYS